MSVAVTNRERAAGFRALFEDEAAFGGWYRTALPQVYGYLFHRCGGVRAVAEELTQETFVDVVRHRHRFDGRSDPNTWVIAIARHKLVDHFRRATRDERRHLRLIGDQEPAPGSDVVALADLRADVLRALRSVPAMQRAVLVLHYLDDLPLREIASAIGRNESATESLLRRGRESLRRALDAEEAGDE